MTLRQISYLLAVAETGSFTAAARRMHVSQPSLSQQIRSLEAELGGPLLERPPKPVKLTTAGRAFLTEARACVTAANRAAESARSAMKLQVGELRVSTVLSLATSQLPSVIRRWQVSHPAIAVHLHEHTHRDLASESVLEGESDLAIAPRPSRWSGAIHRIGWDELVVVLPRSDPSSEIEGPMPLNSLAGRDWVLFEPGHGLHDIAVWACREAGFEPHGIAYTAQVEAAIRLAGAGVGPALVPVTGLSADMPQNVRHLDPPVVWEICAYTAEDTWSPQARELLKVLREEGWERRRTTGSTLFRHDTGPQADLLTPVID